MATVILSEMANINGSREIYINIYFNGSSGRHFLQCKVPQTLTENQAASRYFGNAASTWKQWQAVESL